ncbi:helix-turn-helix transcriptional regulator [Bacillus sp. UNCCL81]|uniref:helix-turn-helix domain-containing protein n=1 Tax=Bacillus sp. UNCCL81 TaxID=1502755 RepID=UPI0008E7D628|nr:helix-turn-helix transcriptional regulator [Bacillus sp. UNCCL81]SFD44868.1 DNA-binding transcriptional regulator, XRE-family HTH domain [Bacillus sp. UNCCL81]
MLSERLKELRKRSKLTQDQLAKKVNTKKTTISNYETGYSTPSNEMLTDLAKVFEVSTDYLLGVDSQTVNTIDDLDWIEGVQILQRANKKLSPKEKARMIRMIEALLDEDEDED